MKIEISQATALRLGIANLNFLKARQAHLFLTQEAAVL
jgi:hypothetical protein